MAILAMIGLALMVVGAIWLVIVIFKEGGILWGIGSLIIPFVALIYVAMHWGEKVKNPFFVWGAGWLLILVGSLLGG